MQQPPTRSSSTEECPGAPVDASRVEPAKSRAHFLFDWYGPRRRVQAGGHFFDVPFAVYSGNTTVIYGTGSYDAMRELMDGSGYSPIVSNGARTRAFVELWINEYRDTSVGPYTAVLLFAVGAGKTAPPVALPDPQRQPFSAVLPFFTPGDKALVNLGLVVTSSPAVEYGRSVLKVAKQLRKIEIFVNDGYRHTIIQDEQGEPHFMARLRAEASSDDRWDACKELSAMTGFEAVVRGLVQSQRGLPVPHGRLMVNDGQWHTNESRYQFNPAYWRINPSSESLAVKAPDTRLGERFAGIDFEPHVGARDPQLKVVIFPEGEPPDP